MKTRGRPSKDYSCNGESHKLKEWAKIIGVKEETLRHRMIGRSFEDAIQMGKRGKTRKSTLYAVFNGRKMPVVDIARETGFNYSTLRARLVKGMSVEEALNTPIDRKAAQKTLKCPYPNCFECPYADCIVDKI